MAGRIAVLGAKTINQQLKTRGKVSAIVPVGDCFVSRRLPKSKD